jgi:hypothetical protein
MLQISCNELNFASGIDEPLFCSFAVYDMKNRAKLSETMYFQFTKDDAARDAVSLVANRKCLIPVTLMARTTPYLIIRIEKILSGDIDKEITRYSRKAVSLQFYIIFL